MTRGAHNGVKMLSKPWLVPTNLSWEGLTRMESASPHRWKFLARELWDLAQPQLNTQLQHHIFQHPGCRVGHNGQTGGSFPMDYHLFSEIGRWNGPFICVLQLRVDIFGLCLCRALVSIGCFWPHFRSATGRYLFLFAFLLKWSKPHPPHRRGALPRWYFTQKYTMFRAAASSPTQVPCNIPVATTSLSHHLPSHHFQKSSPR